MAIGQCDLNNMYKAYIYIKNVSDKDVETYFKNYYKIDKLLNNVQKYKLNLKPIKNPVKKLSIFK